MTLKERLDIYIQSYTKITKIAGLVQFWTKLASIGVIAIMVRNALVGRIKLFISQAQFDAYKDTSFLPPKEWVDGFTAMQTRNALEASGLIFISNMAKGKKDLFQTYATGFKTAKEYEDKLGVLKIAVLDAKSKFTRMVQQQRSMKPKELELVESLIIAIDRDIENIDKEIKSISKMKSSGESMSFLKGLFNMRTRDANRIVSLIDEHDRIDVDKLTEKEAMVLLTTILTKYKNSIGQADARAGYTNILSPFILGLASPLAPMLSLNVLRSLVSPKKNMKLNTYLRKLKKSALTDFEAAQQATRLTKSIIGTLTIELKNMSPDKQKEAKLTIEYLKEILNAIK